MRSRLGFNYRLDLAEFWRERINDLASLKPREFARRHNVPVHAVLGTQRKLLGKFVRPLGWWHKPEFLEILRSDLSLRVMGEKLGISTSQTHRLRDRARLGSETGTSV